MDLDHFADDSNQTDLYVVVAVVLLVLIYSFVETVNSLFFRSDHFRFIFTYSHFCLARSQDERTRGKDSKGKEIAGVSRRTRPQLNFLAILADYSVTLDFSCREELCQKLYDGVYLKPNRLKYFVDKESNKNCFVLFARELSITHGDNLEHWQWITEKEASGEVIEVAELLKVWWLDITGYIRIIDLSPGTMYEIVFVVKKMDSYSNFSGDLILRPQHSNLLTTRRSASLEQKPSGKWFEILVDEFMMSPKFVGIMEFILKDYDLDLIKAGLVVKCAIIRPKK